MLSEIMTEKPLRLCEAVFCFLANLLQLLRLPSAEIVRYRLSLVKKHISSEVTQIGGLFFIAEICPSKVGYGIIRDRRK